MKLEDLTFISMDVHGSESGLHPYRVPYNDMKSVIAYAKKNPEMVSVAIGTVGGSEHICAHRVGKGDRVRS